MSFVWKSWRGRTRLVVGGLVLLVVLTSAAVAYALSGGEPAPSAKAGTARVDRGEVLTAVATTGSLEPAQTRTLGFATGGTVTVVNVRPGDEVKAGQVLAEIDAVDAKERVEDARQTLDDAEESLHDAQADSDDAQVCTVSAAEAGEPVPVALTATGGAPPSPTATASPSSSPRPSASPSPTRSTAPSGAAPTSGGGQPPGGGQAPGGDRGSVCTGARGGDPVLSAQQRVTAAELALDEAQDQLDGTKIKAPIAGKILSVTGTVGADVGAGRTFVSLADVAGMQVAADLPEAYAGHLETGQSATVTLANRPGEGFAARVVRVDPVGTADGDMVRYGVVLAFEEVPQQLLVGQSANVRVRTGERDSVLRVPSTAVRGDGTVTVRTAAGDETRTVGIGMRGDQYTEITHGLIEGDEIVLAGAQPAPR